ncbi:MAG TPA: NUDIX hydrolase [Acidimicrobiales bacterium]|nr:NUDIX hydrolase [Acidimicrobiales bacterium]
MSAESLMPRDAATVMLVRNAAQGFEVCMLRRNLNSDFVGGAYVFPGGAVDPGDRLDALAEICTGRSDQDASQQLGVEAGGLAFWVAAVRECFEEAGVLLAIDETGTVVSFADADTEARFVVHRRAVDGGELDLVDLCRTERLLLDVRRIHYFSHWITPVGPSRRYDTRFFVAAAPPEQVPLHDDRETIATIWVSPSDALDRHQRGELELIFPTIRNLEAIARFDTAEELLAAAAAIENVPAILPRIVNDRHGVRILLPGDPGYDDIVDGRLPEGLLPDGSLAGHAVDGREIAR